MERLTPMAELPSILIAASEVIGFAKTGGLADVSGYLPLALRRRGHPVAVIMPLYRSVRLGKVPIHPTVAEVSAQHEQVTAAR